ncbi:MAG: CpsD/CapB family tyrosine-protein kinase, partial [Planctomycetota bacterium]|nr:CpsD/CapB family tyrosine-protein kinase [Planctomycetota bacterium]
RTDYDIRRYVNIPCISLFEEVKTGSPFILRGSPKDPASENFNMAASIVRTYLTERNFKTLAICSAIPKEGKTTIACNVAVAMARKGLRVVVVDADLRIPQIHEIFSVSNGRGLSSLLKGEIEIENLDDALIQTDLETLCVLPSGPVPEGPNTLLESQKMVDLVNTLRARFDVVVFDTPPITSVGDTLTLARIMDTNLLVVAAGLSDRRSVIWAKQMLTSVRGEICGGVLNFVKRRQVSAYYYYYSYYHSSSGSKKSKSLRGKD